MGIHHHILFTSPIVCAMSFNIWSLFQCQYQTIGEMRYRADRGKMFTQPILVMFLRFVEDPLPLYHSSCLTNSQALQINTWWFPWGYPSRHKRSNQFGDPPWLWKPSHGWFKGTIPTLLKRKRSGRAGWATREDVRIHHPHNPPCCVLWEGNHVLNQPVLVRQVAIFFPEISRCVWQIRST